MPLTDEELVELWNEECEMSSILGVPHLKMRKNINHWTPADVRRYFETNGAEYPPKPEPKKAKVAMLFAGQGTQRVGMAGDLKNTELFDEASAILGYDLLKLCNEGPDEQLQKTAFSQPAVFVTSLASAQQYRLDNPDESSGVCEVAGFSLGEFSALVYTGAISFEEGLRLVQTRAEAMQTCGEEIKGEMCSVMGMEDDALQELCRDATKATGKDVQVANLLFPKGRSLSGDPDAIGFVEKNGKARGASVVKRIKTSGAFHTNAMAGAQEKLSEMLDKTTITMPENVNIYSNVTGKPYSSVKEMRELLKRQVVEPVVWEQTMKAIVAGGPEKYIETGPGKQLKAMLKRNNMAAEKLCTCLMNTDIRPS